MFFLKSLTRPKSKQANTPATKPTTRTANMSLPQMMKAIQYIGVGGPEVIVENRVPVPVPASNEILIKVKYSGVNLIDTYLRTGIYPMPSLPYTVGGEAAGVVVRLPTDPAILNNPAYKARNYRIGQTVAAPSGPSYAEYIVKNWVETFPVPDSISPKIAGSVALQGLTALTFIEEAYEAKRGDYVLIHSAAGGLGLAMSQLLKARGVHVIGSVSSHEKAALARENGVEFVVVYTKEDLVKRVNEITNGLGVHGIYDGVGKTTWDANFDMIRRKGTIVALGNASGVVPPINIMQLKPKNVQLCRPMFFTYMNTPEEVNNYFPKLWKAIESGEFKVTFSKEYPFTVEAIREAQIAQGTGKTMGKLTIKISD